MTEAIGWAWLVEIQWMAAAILICAEVACWLTRQPARRLVVARVTLASLAFVVALNTARAGIQIKRSGDATGDRVEAPQHTIHGSDCACHDPIGAAPAPSFHRRSIMGGFGLGSILTLSWLGIGAVRSKQLARRGVTPPADRLSRIWTQVAGPLTSRVALGVSGAVDFPAILGPHRPTILLPARFAASQADRVIEAALRHEIAHARRGDLWMMAFVRLFFPLLYANPLFIRFNLRMRNDQELLADAEVASTIGVVAYAEAMVDWARSVEPGRRQNIPLEIALGAWSRASSLAFRIETILDSTRRVDPICPVCWRLLASGTAIGLVGSMASVSPPIQGSTPPNKPSTPVQSRSVVEDPKVARGGGELSLECAFQCARPPERWPAICQPERK